MTAEILIKVGGSLHDVPHLGRRLRAFLDQLPTRRVLLLAGGGPATDLVRQADALDDLGQERSHWLALRSLSFMTHVLAVRLENAEVIDDLSRREHVWKEQYIPVLDTHIFALEDERRSGHLPHHWDVTSDSLAARVAVVAGIPELILLKSTALPPGCSWEEAAKHGIVDPCFPRVLSAAARPLRVSVINFRQDPTVPAPPAPAHGLR